MTIFLADETFLCDGTLETSVDWIPGMRNIRLRDLPSFIRTTNIDDAMFDFMGSETRKCMRSSAIIFNTFDELEHDVLEAISAKFPQIYTIGPLSILSRVATEAIKVECVEGRPTMSPVARYTGPQICCLCKLWLPNYDE